jgi:membrane fusion protein, copper/silver efflux system
MTTRDRNLIITGVVVGVLSVGVLLGVARVLRPWIGNTRAGEAVAPAYETAEASSPNEHVEHEHGASSETVEPLANVQLTDDEQRSIGLQTSAVEFRSLRQELVAVGRVDEAETKIANISARIGGRIDQLHVGFTGQPVRVGQAIAEIYSPEVLSSSEEYRLALENRKRLGAAEPQAITGADELVVASRRRLELWGLTPQQIQNIATSEQAQIDLTIFSSVNGIVTERKVTRGQYVNAGDVLYTVADLGTVWVKADIYEADVSSVHVGQAVEITSESLPGAKLRGRVNFLEPMVNAQTRTMVARIQVANPHMSLRPGMFTQVRFTTPAAEKALAVPRSAVVDTGTHRVVFVAKGSGMFEAREVRLGQVSDDYYPVLAGLHAKERVVTQGNFLLDSQTRITGGMSGMFGGSKEYSQQTGIPEPGQWKVTFRSDPSSPEGGSKGSLHVSVQDAQGQPVRDAQVRVTLFMPAMPAMGMGEMRETATLNAAGSEYAGSIEVPTSGTWTVTVEVSRGGKPLTSYRTSLNAK